MSQFDETTEKKVRALLVECRKQSSQDTTGSSATRAGWCREDFKAGRNSVKPSLAIAIKALKQYRGCPAPLPQSMQGQSWVHSKMAMENLVADRALAEITANGDMIGVEA